MKPSCSLFTGIYQWGVLSGTVCSKFIFLLAQWAIIYLFSECMFTQSGACLSNAFCSSEPTVDQPQPLARLKNCPTPVRVVNLVIPQKENCLVL